MEEFLYLDYMVYGPLKSLTSWAKHGIYEDEQSQTVEEVGHKLSEIERGIVRRFVEPDFEQHPL